MVAREQVDKVSLDFVRVLVFVDQNELKLAPVDFRDPLVLLKHHQRFLQQVVEIHRVRGLLLFFVSVPNVLDFVEQRQEVRKLFRKQCFQRHLRVNDETEDFREHITFWKPDFLWINACARHDGIDQILLIFAVHDGEAARVTERGAVPAQNPISNRMECPAPESAGIHRQQIRDAIQHFARCFVREREQQNISGIDAVFEQVRHAICKGARFARARAGDHKDRAGRSASPPRAAVRSAPRRNQCGPTWIPARVAACIDGTCADCRFEL